jgi:plasmid stability protein
VASVTLRHLPPDLHKRLKESAKRNRRSLNAEIISMLEYAIPPGRPSDEEFLARAVARQERLKKLGIMVTDEQIRQYKNTGRP